MIANPLIERWKSVPPFVILGRVIDYLRPEWHEEGNYGFLTFYDRCYFSAIKDLLGRNGFTNVRFSFLYYQSIYFNFSIFYLS